LGLNAISQLIADTLHSDISTVNPLAELVLRKTGGNPFFVNEFLKTLYAENLLSFDLEHLRWRGDITRIESKNITDNVVELMLGKLKKLPLETQQVLQFAACVGAEFDLNTLSIICERSPVQLFSELVTAAQMGLIVPLSELDEQLLVQDYQFLHDRVQQAAYALIDEAHKQVVHLEIGRNLLEKTLLERLTDRVFEIVDHLNHGIELLTNQSERNEIAKLNLIAGQKAKGAIAYTIAKKYLAIAREWLAVSSWQTDYDLTLELFSETTEIRYLCGEFEDVDQWAGVVLQEAKTVLDIVKVYKVKIQTYMAQSQPLKAINSALQVLQQLGISFPKTLSQSDIRLELDAITSLFGEKPIGDLIHLPQMTDPDKLAAMRILSSITVAAYIAAPDLMPLLVSKQVNLSIQYGNASVSPFAYATYGFILCRIVENIESGYEFGQIALRLLSQPNTHSLKARTLLFLNGFITPWKKHIRETLEPFLEGYRSGLETGDLEFASYCAHNYCVHAFVAGKELAEVEREMATYSEAIRQIKQEATLLWIQVYRQSVLNLIGCSVNTTRLVGESYNEENALPLHEAANDEVLIFDVYLNKLLLCYLFCEYAQAVENLTIAERYLNRVTGSPFFPLYYFYNSLSMLATYPESSAQVQAEILKKVALSQDKMKQWSHYASMNHLHKYHLVEAEKAQVLGQLLEAEEFYERAILGARDNEYLQEEALAYELAAKFYLYRGREKFAQTYMKEAHYCYERWGAMAKVKDLETRYPQLLPQPSGLGDISNRTTSKTTSNSSGIAFDLAAVIKASQAIASEIELEQLLNSLMKILIENAGAQTGFLILENAKQWVIEACGELNDGDGENVYATQVLQSIPTANHLPESIINYVIRTQECIILDDAAHQGDFINEPYIKHNKTQSILCLPLLNQSKLVGVLYLENKLATGAFTPERSQVLNLLSTQAAIAIENARLYSELRASESRMKQFLEAVPVGIGVLNGAGRVYYVNQRGIQLMGKGVDPAATPDQIPEVYQFYLAGTDQNYPTEKLPVIRALSGERTTVDDLEIHQNDKIIPVEVWGTPVFDEQDKVAYAIVAFQDITERKQAERLLANYNRTLEEQVAQRTTALQQSEAELRHREQELRLITDALPALVSYVDANQRYQFINRTYEVWFSRSQDEILGKYVHELLGQTVYQIVEPYINQAFEGQTVTLEAEIPFSLGKKPISATLIPDFDCHDQVIGFYSLITDISDQKRAEAASILEERNRMAREIHDTLAQSFTGIIIHARTAANKITVDPEKAQTHLAQVQNLAKTGLSEARRSVEALRRPYLLENSDLLSAFKHLTRQLESSGITIMCEAIGIPYPLPSEVENNLLRIGQEALTNALKYATATEIRVELIYQSAQCILRIKDDGQGFAIDRSSSHNGFGLLGMSERADRIGAQLQIQSTPGQGTEIAVSVNQQEKPS
jgi:PAS domain S-box-containing protein